MNIETPQDIATVPANSIGHSMQIANFGGGGIPMPSSMAEIVEFSQLMCKAGPLLPEIFRNNPGLCMGITMQAMRWQMDPFSVAQKAYVAGKNGMIAYEAQLIAAVVNTRAPIKGRPRIDFIGEGNNRQCVITVVWKDGGEQTHTSPPISTITVKNSPLWKNDPDQQLAYYTLRAFARRHCPEVIMGVYDGEEIKSIQAANNPKDITPEENPLIDASEMTTVEESLAVAQEVADEADEAPETDAVDEVEKFLDEKISQADETPDGKYPDMPEHLVRDKFDQKSGKK